MEPFRDDTSSPPRCGRCGPAPRPDFAAELDERAAAGFPRRSRSAARRCAASLARLRSMPSRAALLSPPAPPRSPRSPSHRRRRARSGSDIRRLSRTEAHLARRRTLRSARFADGSSRAAVRPARQPTGRRAGAPSGMRDGSQPAACRGSRGAAPPDQRRPLSPPQCRHARRRTLGRDRPRRRARRRRKAAAEVFEPSTPTDGIVLRSSIRDGAEGDAGARFELLIPSAKLGDALAAFSAIAEVRSRHEATADITAPTVRTGELLRDSRATIDGLLAQLAAADTEAERAAVEAELRGRAPPRRRPALAAREPASAAPTSRASRCGSRPAPPRRHRGERRLGHRRRPRRRRPHPRHRRRRHHRRPRDPRPDRPDRPARLARPPRLGPPRPRARPRLTAATCLSLGAV